MKKFILTFFLFLSGIIFAQNQYPASYDYKDSINFKFEIRLVQIEGCNGENIQSLSINVFNDTTYLKIYDHNDYSKVKRKLISRNIINELMDLEFEMNHSACSDSNFLLKFLSEQRSKVYGLCNIDAGILQKFFDELN
jgi:hypothetical protein